MLIDYQRTVSMRRVTTYQVAIPDDADEQLLSDLQDVLEGYSTSDLLDAYVLANGTEGKTDEYDADPDDDALDVWATEVDLSTEKKEA